MGKIIGDAVYVALCEAFGETRKIKRPRVVVKRKMARKPRKVRVVQPPTRPFKSGEYDALVIAACDTWRTVAEMRKRPGLTGVIASRLSTKCLAMFRKGKLSRRVRSEKPLEFEYRVLPKATA